ncbi:hypothetical protein [Pseudomonas putida]
MAEDLNSVVKWMERNPQLLDWDMIIAVDTAHLNPGFDQSHLSRWRQGNDIAGIDGVYDVGGLDIKYCLSGMRLGAPQLEVSRASPERPVANVMIKVEGTRTTVESPQKVRALVRYDVLDNALLAYTQSLDSGSGDLLMDVARGESYAFDQRLPVQAQWAGGRFFQSYLEGLAERQRVYVIGGHGAAPQNDYLGSRYINATTRLSADGKRLALLLFVALKHSHLGSTPGEGSDFPFLLPTDLGDDKPGTVLMNVATLQRAAYAEAVSALFAPGSLDHRYDLDQHLQQLVGKSGVLRIPPTDYTSASFKFESFELDFSVAGLTIDFTAQNVRQTWSATHAVKFSYRALGEVELRTLTLDFSFNLEHLFWLLRDAQAQGVIQGQLIARRSENVPVRLTSDSPEFTASERAQVEEFVGYAVTKAFYNALATALSARTPERFLQTFAVADALYFDPQQAHVEAPNNLALFTALAGADQPFNIVQQNVLLKAGQTQQFTLDKAVGTIEWTLEPLPGSAGAWGAITPQDGEYKAPSINALGGLEARVLVVATDTATQARSVAQVTVLTSSISLNPRIQVTQPGQSVVLTAVGLDRSALTWEIIDRGPGSGTLVASEQGDGRDYVAGQRVDEPAFILDHIKVTDSQGESNQAVVLVEQRVLELSVLIAETGQPDFGLKLEARFRNEVRDVRWWLPLDGPGYLDPDTGIYEPVESAQGHFVLIAAQYDSEIGVLEGYIILPLPLAQNSSTLRLLTARADGAKAN